jgi:hypothetical protein
MQVDEKLFPEPDRRAFSNHWKVALIRFTIQFGEPMALL